MARTQAKGAQVDSQMVRGAQRPLHGLPVILMFAGRATSSGAQIAAMSPPASAQGAGAGGAPLDLLFTGDEPLAKNLDDDTNNSLTPSFHILGDRRLLPISFEDEGFLSETPA